MSLLTNVLKSVFANREQPSAAAPGGEPRETPEDDTDDADAAPAPAAPQGPPAWRLLGAETGVQDLEYGDIARPGVQRLFRRPPRRLLDIGCASGAVAAGLKQSIEGLWVWGCELNPQAAEVAAARLDHVTKVPRPQWSAEDIALVRSVDTVLLLDVLEHMYNPWAELEFLAAQLPPDAQVIVSLPNVGHISILDALSRGTFPYAATGILDVTHVRFFTLAEMRAMFVQTGFAIEAEWILSASPNVEIDDFPAQVAAGNVVLSVDTEQDWARLNAIQFGFRLSRAPAG
jgi:2-polyprenyl-3-methyl-5-hydroxy-6-metoxy-1,4-benzoquinol methylase